MNSKISRRDFLKLAGAGAAGLALASCGVNPTEFPTATSIPPTFIPQPSPTATPRAIPASGQIWFGPFMYGQPAASWQDGFGSRDYLDLFENNAPWPVAASRVHIFKSYMYAFDNLSDKQLEKIITGLNKREIAIALETQPLNRKENCGNSEAFSYSGNSVTAITRRIKRFQSLGGEVKFLAMDEPLTFGRLPSPEGCSLSLEQIAMEVAAYVSAIRKDFPDIVIGDIEFENAGVDDVKAFLDSYEKIMGEPLPFLHWDINWIQPIKWWNTNYKQRQFLWTEWIGQANNLESYCREHGTKFGMIYNGNSNAESDGEWLSQAEDHFAMYESLSDTPDHIIFQSWNMYPQYVLPETDPTKFTYIINRYFQTRTKINLNYSGNSKQTVNGKIVDSANTSIINTPVDLLIKPLDGDGVVAEYTVKGIVPQEALRAIVGFRINDECDCSGAGEFILYEIRYVEEESRTSLVPNGDFSQKLSGWSYITPNVKIQDSDIGKGWAMKVNTADAGIAHINSSEFSVTGGKNYTLVFKARIKPTSSLNGYFAIFFPTKTADNRVAIPVEPAFLNLSSATNQNGEFEFLVPSEQIVASHFIFQAHYRGDDKYLPCYERLAV
jgi:hypothetical protein